MIKKEFRETGFWDDRIGRLLIADKSGRLLGEIVYFTEALTIFTAYLFELKPIEHLKLTLNKGNVASRKVAEKCGFKFEGIKRKAIYQRGLYQDIELF